MKSQNLNVVITQRANKLDLAKKNVLTLAIAQGLSITSTGINIIHTGLVGAILAPNQNMQQFHYLFSLLQLL